MKKSFFAIFIALLLCIDASAIKITIYGRATEVTTNGPTTTVKCDGFHEEVCMTIELMPGNNGDDKLKIGPSGTVVREGNYVNHFQSSATDYVVEFQ